MINGLFDHLTTLHWSSSPRHIAQNWFRNIDHCCCPKCVQLISCPVLNWCLRYCWKDTVDQGRERAIEDKMQCKMLSKWSSIKRKQLLWNLHLEWNSWSHFLNVGISIKPRVILLISTQRTATRVTLLLRYVYAAVWWSRSTCSFA